MSDSKFTVSRAAQSSYKVLGGTRPAGAHATARTALSKAHASRKPSAVHVVCRGDRWAVKSEGKDRAASVRPTKAQAVKDGRRVASAKGGRLIEHGVDGRFSKNTKPASTNPKATAKGAKTKETPSKPRAKK